jgi:cell division cycle 14
MSLRVSCPFQSIEIIPKRIMFSLLKRTPRANPRMQYFTIDGDPHFKYRGFFDDFGPPAIVQLVDLARFVEQLMANNPTKTLHYYTSPSMTPTSNSALYIGFFRMYHLKLNPDDTYRPFHPIEQTFKGFRDASRLPSVFELRVLDCLRGLHQAMVLRWLQLNTFDSEAWRSMGTLEHGDMTWIIPGKVLALASPYSTNTLPRGITVCRPSDLIAPFRDLGITHIIRLNKQFYDADEFRKEGFDFTELYFLDGSCPPELIRLRFLEICESNAVIATHCKAGLGRTYFCIANAQRNTHCLSYD